MAGEAPGGALRQIFARFAVSMDTAPLTAGAASVDAMAAKLQSLGNQLAGAAIVVGLQNFVSGIAATGDELSRQAQVLDLSTQSLQEWRAAASAVGVTAEQLTPAIQALRRNAEGSAHGGGMAADFRRLGVSLRDSNGQIKDSDTLLREVADGMTTIENPTQRAAIAMRLMGDSGALLLPMMADGADGVQRAADAFQELGGGMSEEAIAASKEYTAQMRALDQAFLGVKSRIAVFVLPALARLGEALSRATAMFAAVAEKGNLLPIMFAAIGTAAVLAGAQTIAAWIGAAAPFVLAGLAIAALILVLEDLSVEAEGGKSVLAGLSDQVLNMHSEWTAALGPLITQWEFFRGVVLSVVAAVGRLAGNDRILGDLATFQDPQNEEQRLANSIVVRRRATQDVAGVAGEAFMPDSFERFQAVQEARSIMQTGQGRGVLEAGLGVGLRASQQAPKAVTISIGKIDTTGVTPEEAGRLVERAVSRALSAQADDMDETLAGQGA